LAPLVSRAQETSFNTIGEKRVLLSSASDVARLSRTIELTRTAVGHLLNARSSRSHCLVHLHVAERLPGGGGGEVALSKRRLLFADLAGSERILKTGAEGVAAQQAVAINTSLTALGKCVRAIASRQDYVPYRESTLTQLLRSSLAGRAALSAVVTVASDAAHTDESKCSLEYFAAGPHWDPTRALPSSPPRAAATWQVRPAVGGGAHACGARADLISRVGGADRPHAPLEGTSSSR
jgi:hypothetical protein